MWQKVNDDKPQINTKSVNEKVTKFVVLDIGITTIVIDNHMVVIQVQIGKNTIDDVILDGGSKVNIIIE